MRTLLDENFYWRLQETGYARAAGVAASTPAVIFSTSVMTWTPIPAAPGRAGRMLTS